MRDANGRFTRGHQQKLKHGHAMVGRVHPLYGAWGQMIQRCTSPGHARWENYGGRGITVCRRWRKFENFLADMGERPKGLTLERRDNDKGYSPGNCCWATRAQQARNQGKTIRIGDGCLKDAAVRAGLKPPTVYMRRRRGWPESRWFE